MSLPSFSIKRPVFVGSIVIFIILIGWITLKRLGVDMFPDINFPIISVSTIYPGSSPEEVETLISKVLEEEISSLSGLQELTSINSEGLSVILAKFSMETDIKDAEQQMRTKVSKVRHMLPDDIEEPLLQRMDPADIPVIRLSLSADITPAELYDLANEKIKPQFEQIKNIGAVKILGGVRREIQIELDRNKLNQHQISAVNVASQLKNYGSNIPIGKYDNSGKEITFKTLGRFEKLDEIKNAVISFSGDVSGGLTIERISHVTDGLQEARTKAFLRQNSTENVNKEKMQPALFLDVYKQSGANTVEVAHDILKKIQKVNSSIESQKGSPKINVVRDSSVWIEKNIEEAYSHVLLAIALTIIVVYFFLGNVRSTFITGIALPNSILGAFIIMYMMGFTINIMTLLAITLSVGLLVDDAIVVRENIFRKIEEGRHPVAAAVEGTQEVMMAVVATTATVVCVFLPVGFMTGMVGQFFKQFGLTMVFAMLVSLFDGLVVGPMLSAYFSGKKNPEPNILILKFQKFQDLIEEYYVKLITYGLKKPSVVLGLAGLVFFLSLASLKFVKGTFMPPQDQGEFMVNLELPPGTSLDGTEKVVNDVIELLSKKKEIALMAIVLGSSSGESNQASIGIAMVERSKRQGKSTFDMKNEVREDLKDFTFAKPSVNDYSIVGGGGSGRFSKNFVLNIVGEDIHQLEEYALKVVEEIKTFDSLTEVEANISGGKPEFQIKFDRDKMTMLGVTPGLAGAELRYHIAGGVVGKLYENGIEYDVRMRLQDDQRNLQKAFYETRVPNNTFRYVPLSAVSSGVLKEGPVQVLRENRARIVQITANLNSKYGIAEVVQQVDKIFKEKYPLPEKVSYRMIGQAEEFKNMMQNILLAFGIALVTIYLVLASLYESFITPFTIFMAIPPAISGAFLALAITGKMLDIFTMIGIIMLLGIVTKNSILLVDFALERVRNGQNYHDAIIEAGRLRLRPILMTSFAMIAGTMPIALGIGEAAKMRASMGVAIVGGLFVSTFLTLVIVPLLFEKIDRFREKIESFFRPDYDISLAEVNDSHTSFKSDGKKPIKRVAKLLKKGK